MAIALSMSPREFLATHTSHDIAEWEAFYRLQEQDATLAAESAKVKGQVSRARRGRR